MKGLTRLISTRGGAGILLIGIALGIVLGVVGALALTSLNSWHAPTPDAWLTFIGAVVAVIGTFIVGGWTARLALGNALEVSRLSALSSGQKARLTESALRRPHSASR